MRGLNARDRQTKRIVSSDGRVRPRTAGRRTASCACCGIRCTPASWLAAATFTPRSTRGSSSGRPSIVCSTYSAAASTRLRSERTPLTSFAACSDARAATRCLLHRPAKASTNTGTTGAYGGRSKVATHAGRAHVRPSDRAARRRAAAHRLSLAEWAAEAMQSLRVRLATELANLQTERGSLPKEIATAEAERERLVKSLDDLTGPARLAIEARPC